MVPRTFAGCAALTLWLWAGTGYAEEGQYRSKILIDPGNALSAGVAQSIGQLENQINAMTDPYAKSSTGRHLARHYVQNKEYDKAIAYYQTALSAEGLSAIANREMLREMAQVYLLQKDYAGAATAMERALAYDLVADSPDYLLLAHAYNGQKDYVGVVKILDGMAAKKLTLDTAQMRQAMALYYRAGAYAQCAALLQKLLLLEPDNAQNWHQLAAVYLLQNKQRAALDQLSLAYDKGVPFTEQDIVLLASLYAANSNPFAAAQLLQNAMDAEKLPASGENYRKLFEYWLHAREKERAGEALLEAARLTGDIELYLHLAQLQMEREEWRKMQGTLVAACAKPIADKYVSRANLLLGISQLKLGDEAAARRSFINATLIGGASAQAGQWLQFMQAEPASKREARNIVSICYGANDKRGKLSGGYLDEPREEEAGDTATALAIKTVPKQRFFAVEERMSGREMALQAPTAAIRLGIALMRAGGAANGPLHLITSDATGDPDVISTFQLALPTADNPRNSGRYKLLVTQPMRCAYARYSGPADGIGAAWKQLISDTLEQGYAPTGESRTVFAPRDGESSAKAVNLELQLGIE
jgi:effector-binding domain-containing protein